MLIYNYAGSLISVISINSSKIRVNLYATDYNG